MASINTAKDSTNTDSELPPGDADPSDPEAATNSTQTAADPNVVDWDGPDALQIPWTGLSVSE